MTKIKLERKGNAQLGYRYSVKADGHATGNAAVCAAISALLQALDAWLEASGATVHGEGLGYGTADIRFAGNGCNTAFDFLCAGFQRLAMTDPEAVSLCLKK